MAFVDTDTFTATIGTGETQSNQVNLGSKTLVGFAIGAEWTSANLEIDISLDGGTTWIAYFIYSTGLTANSFTAINPTNPGWYGINCIRCTASATQTDGAIVTFLARGFN